jgi:NAD(P)H-hydrate epimerase
VIQRELPATDFVDAVLADIERFGALVIGPGLGRADECLVAVRRCIAEAPLPVVVDGDGIFATAWGDDSAASVLRARTGPTVLTPHDGEFALFTGERPGADRIAAARGLAERLGATVLLKGPTTVVADVDGQVLLVDHGDERLATAGSGDVLAGVIGRLLAAGLPPLRAAAAGAWIHAEAGRLGPRTGLLAGDLPELLPTAIGGLG